VNGYCPGNGTKTQKRSSKQKHKMRLSCSWSVMRGGSQSGSRVATVEPACHVLEDGVTRQLTCRRVSCSCSHTGKRSFRSRSFRS